MSDLITEIVISESLNVAKDFDVDMEIRDRVDFLADYLKSSDTKTLVLGISGGVDSLTAGKLAQLAVEKNRADGYDCKFIAVRLPYGIQRDETDAQNSLAFISPDKTVTVDIQPASDALLTSIDSLIFSDPKDKDFVLGNIKARQRMVAQYAIAGANKGLVIGTDHAAEALMGFFTKFGDGACDVTPLSGLNKRRVRAIAVKLGAPDELVFKVPTADLETLNPGLPDETAYGVTYDEIDDFLEGKVIDPASWQIIFDQHCKTMHKRSQPVGL